MPRDIAGNYTLPAGNPVVPSTIIATTWANTTMQDIADALSASLSVDGSVTTAKLATGAVTTPKLADDAVTPVKLGGLDVEGVVVRSSSSTFVGRSITGTTNKITVNDGDGVAGPPTITIPDVVTLVTPTVTGLLSCTGGQIKFPATQNPSGDANTLDDYEEGSWTPTLSFAVPGNLSVGYSTRIGSYVKLGSLVEITLSVSTSSFTHTTASGNLQISTLPFTPNGTFIGTASFQGITRANYTQFGMRASSGVSSATMYASGSGQPSSSVVAADMPTGSTVILQMSAIIEV